MSALRRYWRGVALVLALGLFVIAVLAGIIPASFFLVHVGGAAISSRYGAAALVAIWLGLPTGILLLIASVRRKGFGRQSPAGDR